MFQNPTNAKPENVRGKQTKTKQTAVTSLNDQIIDSLNFSGDKQSWFDLWHLHVEVHPEVETEWAVREESTRELVRLYRRLQERMISYPREYQIWIEVYDEYVGDDAIFIHTRNPNSDNFPARVQKEFPPEFENLKLKELMFQSGLTVAGQRIMNGNVYFLYDPEVGVSLS